MSPSRCALTTVLAFIGACTSFGASGSAPTEDAGTIPADAGMTADADAAPPPASDDFLVPLGATGCRAVPNAKFCDDFEANQRVDTNWMTAGDQSGVITLGSDEAAPSPSHYADIAKSDAVLAAEGPNCLTPSHLNIHEQWAAPSQDRFQSFPTDVPRQEWIYIQETVDFSTKTFTLKVKGIPQTLSFTLQQAANLSGTGQNVHFAAGYACSAWGGELGFDDIVVTYE